MSFLQIVETINGLGTLLIAALVAWLGFRQHKSEQAHKASEAAHLLSQRQHSEQDLRVSLLKERAEVIEDFRSVYGEFFREAGLEAEGRQKMIAISQRASLLFHRELSEEIKEMTDLLLRHQIVSKRVNSLRERDPRNEYQAKLDEQFVIEDKVWDSLGPLLEKLVNAAKVTLD